MASRAAPLAAAAGVPRRWLPVALAIVLAAGAGAAAAADRLAGCNPAHVAVKCAAGATCPPAPLFDVPDHWHGLSSCLRTLRNLWSRQGADASVDLGTQRLPVREVVRRQLIGEIARPTVALRDAQARRVDLDTVVDARGRWRRPPASMALLNDIGVPYNGMGQGDMAYFLAQFGVLARRAGTGPLREDASMYLALAQASIEVNLAPVAQGGLATEVPCPDDLRCTWYHSVTRRDRPSDQGATLNQHLHVVRDLGMLARLYDSEGLPGADRLRRAAQTGLAQVLVDVGSHPPGAPPTLTDFVRPSNVLGLAFYGYSRDAGAGYFLNTGGKDCHYHVHSLELFHSILELDADYVSAHPRLRSAAADCRGPLGRMAGAVGTLRSQIRADPSSPAARACPELRDHPNEPLPIEQSFATCR